MLNGIWQDDNINSYGCWSCSSGNICMYKMSIGDNVHSVGIGTFITDRGTCSQYSISYTCPNGYPTKLNNSTCEYRESF